MADSEYFNWPEDAQAIPAKNLTSVNAKLTHSACVAHSYLIPVETTCTKINNLKLETLIVDVTPDIIQHPVYDIHFTERMAIVFNTDDEAPSVFALRKSFPTVPHLNRSPIGSPKSLCIDEMVFEERKLTWTAEDMLMRIVNWLEQTARGTLHQPGQSLEPLFHHNASILVLPAGFGDEEKRKNNILLCESVVTSFGKPMYVLNWQAEDEYNKIWPCQDKRPPPVRVLYIEGEPQPHGIIDDSPFTLFALHDVMQKANIDLIPTLTKFIKSIVSKKQCDDNDTLLIIFKLPITRHANGNIERIDRWAFCVEDTIKEIGKKLRALTDVIEGVTQVCEDLSDEPFMDEENMNVEMLNPMDHLTPAIANLYNNLPDNSHERQFAMIGCGALGSTILGLYLRMGFGQWSVTDNDKFLPHNIARHHLSRPYLGMPKTQAFAIDTLSLYYESRIMAFSEDFLKVTSDSPFFNALSETEAIIDVSASIAVARKLALDIDTQARKISVFITPSGKDSVLIAEDIDKRFTLDLLEAQYYRELIRHSVRVTHLSTVQASHRYGGGCRDLSGLMPYDTITAHAAILCHQVRRTLDNETACLVIWQYDDETGSISPLPLPIVESFTLTLGDWTVIYDQCLLEKMTVQRQAALPNETGGPLVGYFDMLRRRIYLVDSLPSPPDSKSSSHYYIRGKVGVRESCDEINKRTAGIVEFIGDWHSHPDNHTADMSEHDLILLAHHSLKMSQVGCPALIAILSENGQLAFHLGKGSSETSTPLVAHDHANHT